MLAAEDPREGRAIRVQRVPRQFAALTAPVDGRLAQGERASKRPGSADMQRVRETDVRDMYNAAEHTCYYPTAGFVQASEAPA